MLINTCPHYSLSEVDITDHSLPYFTHIDYTCRSHISGWGGDVSDGGGGVMGVACEGNLSYMFLRFTHVPVVYNLHSTLQ